MGDFNAHSQRWGYANNNSAGRILEDFIDSNQIEFVENSNGLPTFLSYGGTSSHPDLLLAHPALLDRISHVLLPAPGGAGHKLLMTTLSSQRPRSSEIRFPRWNLRRADWKNYRRLTDSMLSDHKLSTSFLTGNIDKVVGNLTEIILECAKICIPRGQVKRYSPFWNDDLQTLKDSRDKLYKIAESTGQLEDCIALRKGHAILKRAIKEAKRNSFHSFLEGLDFRRDALKAHRFLSQINGQVVKRCEPIKMLNNKLLTSNREIARAFNKHYASISNFRPSCAIRKDKVKLPSTCLTPQMDDLFNSPFTMCELTRAVNCLTKSKSPGPDGILPEFLIDLGDKAKIVLLNVINNSWNVGLPNDWRKAEIIPILKIGKDPSEIKNYRPISLTSFLCKLTERLIANRLMFYLEDFDCISDRQAGFRRNRNTVEQVTRLTQLIKDGFQRKQSSVAVFVDFQTAFDRVWRRGLLKKIIDLGICGKMYAWIKSFLSQRFIRTRFGGFVSSYRQTRQGLPQGSVLSPILFNIMINDVIHRVMSVEDNMEALLFADDLVLLSTNRDIEDIQYSLNRALESLRLWSSVNELNVNLSKTNFQIFTLSTKPKEVILYYGQQQLNRTDSAKYLGITLDSRLKWNRHTRCMIDIGTARNKLLKRLAGVKWGATQDLLCNTYKAYIRPAFEYGAELLVTASDSVVKKLDIVQNNALRVITGGAHSTPVEALQLQAGLEPLEDRRQRAALRLAEKLLRRQGFWASYFPAHLRIKTQKTFVDFTGDLANKFGIPTLNRAPLFHPDRYYRHINIAPHHLDLILPVSKQFSLDTELKMVALATINERYPSSEWTHVFTDGSASNGISNAGAGVYSKDFSISRAVGEFANNFDGEMAAVTLALEEIGKSTKSNFVILIDSQATISALISVTLSKSRSIFDAQVSLHHLLDEGRNIVLQWIPSHCGISGNDAADDLAKRGADLPQPPIPVQYHTIKRIINYNIKHCRRNFYRVSVVSKTWSSILTSPIPSCLPRAVGVANFRLKTSHDYLQCHLHRIGLADSPLCPLCEVEDMTEAHLYVCPELQDVAGHAAEDVYFNYFYIAGLYWAARKRLMALWPRSGVG